MKMTLYDRRDRFKSISMVAGNFFSRFPLSPNQWTLLALLIALIGFITILYGNIMAGGLIFSIAAFIDVIDGSVARATKNASNFGAYLDTITDKYIEFIAISSLLLLNIPDFITPSYSWIILLAFGCLMTSFAKSASAEKNVVPHKKGHGASGSILDHTDRQLIIILSIFLVAFSIKVLAIYIIAATAVLANISALQRIINARNIWSRNKIRK